MLKILKGTSVSIQKHVFNAKDMNKDRPIDLLCMKGFNIDKDREVDGKKETFRFSILKLMFPENESEKSKKIMVIEDCFEFIL